MNTCFSCQTELSEQALYCKICGTQVRCKNPECRDVLEADARFCATCGVSTKGRADAVVVTNGNGGSSDTLNTLDFDETTKSRSLHAKLTDRAVESLSNSLGVYVGNHISVVSRGRRGQVQPTAITDNEQLRLPGYSPETIDQPDGNVIDVEPSASVPHAPAAGTERENLRRFFSYDGDRLRLIDSRLKAKSKRDQGQRLAILFLYAHELEDREKVPRASLNTILEEAKVNDGNIRFWIGKADEFLKDGNKIGLSVPGRERARKILAEALDSTIPDSWSLNSATRARGGKSGGAAEDRKGKASKTTGGKRATVSNAVTEWKTKWEALSLNVNGFKLIKDRKILDKGIFGLWAIRRAANDEGKIVSRGKLKSFLHEAFEIPVDERHLERSLQSKAAKGMVMKVPGGYQIQPDGMEYAAQMAGITKGTTSASTKGTPKK